MVHAREDYNRIQDPAVNDSALLSPGSTPIADDEPVFLLRAQDRSAPDIVEEWADLNLRTGGDPLMSKKAVEHAERMRRWQSDRGCKVPDMPHE